MRKKDKGGSIRPIIVELKTEYDKWTVLRNTSDLREINEYRNVFRAGCIEGRKRKEANNDSGKEGGMGAEREKDQIRTNVEKRSHSVKLVWKNVRKIRTREKQLEVWMKTNECDVCAIN